MTPHSVPPARCRFPRRFVFLVSLVVSLACTAVQAASGETHPFNVPAGTLETSIKQFSLQSGLEVLIRSDATMDVRTHAVNGEMTSREALKVMLQDTGLAVVEDPSSGAVTVTRAEDPKVGQMVSQTAGSHLENVAAVEHSAPSRTAGTESTVVLSPFIVEDTTDVGYRASVSSSGSRLNTDYQDIANHLEVMTADFLNDIGANTIEGAFSYSANTESPAESWAAGAGTGDGFLATATASVAPSRTRGLSRATPTRNYFRTLLPFDTYNSYERGLTIASGPNPGLFGLGSPSGITNSDYNRAVLNRRKGQLRLITDSNASRRVDVDYNLPLIKNKLALRTDLLWSDKRYPTEGNYAKDKRATGIISWAPVKRLTVDVYGEYLDRRSSMPYYGLPTDAVTPWINPGIGNRTPFTTPDVSPDAAGRGNIPGNNAYLGNWVGGAADAPTYTFGGARPAGVYNYRYTAVVGNLGRYMNQVTGVAPVIGTPALANESLYPFHKYALFARPSVLSAKDVTAIANLKVAEGLFVEFGADYQAMFEKNATMYSPSDITLYIDPNQYAYDVGYIPADPITNGATKAANQAANAAHRMTNPNFGALYIDGSEAAIYKDNGNTQARLSVAYDFEPNRYFARSTLAQKLFSRQRLLGTLSSVDSHLLSARYGRYILDNVDPATGAVTTPSVITAANSKVGSARYMTTANRAFRIRQYIDPSSAATAIGQLPLDPFSTWNFVDANNQGYSVGLLPNTTVSSSRSTDDAASFVYQGYFLQNRLILTYTRSYDRVRTKMLDPNVNVLSAATGLVPYYPTIPWTRFEDHPTFVNSSKSAVLHALKWLSFHYNESTNADPTPPTSHTLNGNLNPFSDGDNKEYGVLLSWRGLGLSINQYKTWQTNVDVGNAYGNLALGGPSDRLEGRYLTLQRARTYALALPDYNDFYGKAGGAPGYDPLDNGMGTGYYRLFGDNYAKGTEIELTGRMGNLDVRFAASKTDSVRSNIGPSWLQYATDPAMIQRMQNVEWYAFDSKSGQYRPVVAVTSANAPVFGNIGQTPLKGWDVISSTDAGSKLSMYDTYRQSVLPGALFTQKLQGTTNPLLREWRYNATVAYNLGHWRMGLSVRQRAKGLVGYLSDSVTVDIGGNQISTYASVVDKPIYSAEQWYFDPFVSYRGKFNRKYDYSIQLNVYNALNNHKLILNAVSASTANNIDVNDPRWAYYGWTNPLSIGTGYQIQDPITAQLTFRIGF